jgi:NADH dehydrogenase
MKIVILGAGRAGLAAALCLEKRFQNYQDIAITLVDRHDYHLLNDKLFGVATSDEELADIQKLKSATVLPIREVFSGKAVKFVQGEVLEIDARKNRVHLHRHWLEYDYLVLALGDVPNFSSAKGAQEYGLPLRSLADALRIRNALGFLVETRRLRQSQSPIRIAVAGGGEKGVEFAAELKNCLDFLAWKNGFPKEDLEIAVYEAQLRLLPRFDYRLSQSAFWRLKQLGVGVELEKKVISVDRHFLVFQNGEKIQYDMLVWTAGSVPAKTAILQGHFLKAASGDLLVNEHLQLKDNPNIFVIGRQAGIESAAYNPGQQAEYLAYALPRFVRNRRPMAYQPKRPSLILKIGPRWAIADLSFGSFTGYFGYFICQLSHFNYLCRLLGFRKALKFWF